MASESYSTFEAAKILGEPIAKIREWINRGFISPDLERAKGRGTKGKFSRVGLYKLRLLCHLRKQGISREHGQEIADTMLNLAEKNMRLRGFPEFIWVAWAVSTRVGPVRYGGITGETDTFTIRHVDRYDDVYIVNFGKLRREVDTLIG
jgi:MerR HTH family regulatory protein